MKSLWNEFKKYAVPSVVGMMVSAMYIVVDGIFVGRGIGKDALASINVALPVTTLMIAVTMMVTMGGASMMSIKFGQGKEKEGNDVFLQSMILIAGITGMLSIASVAFPYQISSFLGASDTLIDGTAEYLKYYMMFGIGFSSSLALSAFVRNDRNPNLAMVSLIVGAVTNVVLDYAFIFIFDMGIRGAAIASGLGQLSSVALLSSHFIAKKGSLRIYLPKLDLENFKRILKMGTPEFIVQLSPAISVFAFNIVIIRRIGDIGVAGFSIIGYISSVLLALFIGISQGIQPLLSYNYGKRDHEKVDQVFKMGLKTNFIASLVIYASLIVFGHQIIGIFNSDQKLIALTYDAMSIYAFSFVIASVNIVNVTYYQSTEKSKIANIISSSRGMLFTIGFIALLPNLVGDIGIWSSIVVAEIATFILITACFKKNYAQKNVALDRKIM